MTYDVYAESDSPRASGHNVRLGDLLLRTAETQDRQIVVNTRNIQAARSDDKASVYEEIDDIGFTFARFNHTGGEGLAWFPPRSLKIVPELDPIRFFQSENLAIGREVDDVPYRVELARLYEVLDNTQTFVDICTTNEGIYTADGLTVRHRTDWSDPTPTTYTLTGTTGPILALFGSRADDVCAITDEGDLYIKPKGASAFVLAYEAGVDGSALTAGWWAKGRVIAQRGKAATIETAELLEIAIAVGGTAGAPTAISTVTVTDTFDADVLSVVDAAVAIVVALSNGELRTYVPQTDTAGTTPVLTIRGTTPVPTSEIPYALGYGSGSLLLLTKADTGRVRAYSAEVLDARFDFVVGSLQLIREWSASVDGPDIRNNMVATRNGIHWLIADGTNTSLWTYDTVTTGVFSTAIIGAGNGISLVSFEDVFGLILGTEVWNRGSSYAAEGYLITPNINFGRSGLIAWLNAVIYADQLSSVYGSIEVAVSEDPNAIYDADHASWMVIGALTDDSQSGNSFSLQRMNSPQLAMKITLRGPTNQANTPRLLRYQVRGIPSSRDWEVIVPVNISDLIEVPYRTPAFLPGGVTLCISSSPPCKGRQSSSRCSNQRRSGQG